MVTQTVLVLGANGRFGLACTQAFAAAGWRVLAQVRRQVAPGMPSSVSIINAEVQDVSALIAVVRSHAEKVDVVVHGLNPEYTNRAWSEQAMPLAQTGMSIARHLQALFVFPGNVYPFGTKMPTVLREDTPSAPDTFKGRIRDDIESEIARQAEQGLHSVVIRAGDFYGGGRGGWMDQVIVKDLAKGRLTYPGPGDMPHAWAFLPDLAKCVVAVSARRDRLPAFSCLHYEGVTVSGKQLMDAIEAAAQQLGIIERPVKRPAFSWGLVKMAAVFSPMYRALLEMSYLWKVPHELSDERLSTLIGAHAATSLPQSLRQTLQTLGYAVPQS